MKTENAKIDFVGRTILNLVTVIANASTLKQISEFLIVLSFGFPINEKKKNQVL